MNRYSRSTLFLMEQLVVILIFAVCAAVCVSIFADSYLMERQTLDVNNALLVAGSAAESYKAAAKEGITYYDENWVPCEEARASHILKIVQTGDSSPSLRIAEITIRRTSGEELVSLTVAARGGGG